MATTLGRYVRRMGGRWRGSLAGCPRHNDRLSGSVSVTDQSDLPGVTNTGVTPVPDAASSFPPPAPPSAPPAPPLRPGPLDVDGPAPAELIELAQAYGVATD